MLGLVGSTTRAPTLFASAPKGSISTFRSINVVPDGLGISSRSWTLVQSRPKFLVLYKPRKSPPPGGCGPAAGGGEAIMIYQVAGSDAVPVPMARLTLPILV